MKRISYILNDRPLSIQKSIKENANADFLTPIKPNMLLTGRSGNLAPVQKAYVADEARLSFVEELERAWWYQYKVQYITSLVPTQKWLKAERNMSIEDAVLLEYKNKSFPGSYLLGSVKHIETDPTNGLVRTCTVLYKLIKAASKTLRNIFKDVISKEVRLPVQRLVLILPIEEQ